GGGWVMGGFSGVFFWPARLDAVRPDVPAIGPPQLLGSGLAGAFSRGTSASADGRVVAVPLGSSTVLLHPKDPKAPRTILGPQEDVRFTAVSPDGRWVIASSHWGDGHSTSAWVWNADTGERVHELPVSGSTRAGFSSDGRWLMTTATDCRLWA